ncbi:MAG: ATP-binding protein [Proteobacteria bacterium]|nr:ATP-binding protein [Pseudomonadota bacterium]
MINRPEYLNKLISWKDRQLVKILTGVRRCGKSTLFQIYQNWLIQNGISTDQIINLNMEDPKNHDLLNWRKLYDFIDARLLSGKKNYVFIDEIQNVADFQRAADGLFIKDNVDLYLTGSNSHFQSGQWATMLSGRYVEIQVLPLSFREYASAYPFPNHSRETMYRWYLENSSFPYTINLLSTLMNVSFSDKSKGAFAEWDTNQIRDYLGGIYNTIILKDVVDNKNIREPSKLERVVKYIADNVGNITSIKKISDAMISDGFKIYPQTIETYVDALQDSYVLYRADRYDVKGKKLLKTLNKYYLVDLGLRYFLLGDRTIDTGKMLENVVYLELLRRNRKVYVGKVDGKDDAKEIDFVVESDKGTEYYQVAESVLDKKTLERELASLESVKDHNPKYLLTMDNLPAQTHNGIKQINALDWLLGAE